jgi:hypothetical protein
MADSEDIVIRIPSEEAEQGTAKINRGLTSIETHGEAAGKAVGDGISAGVNRGISQIEVLSQRSSTMLRLISSAAQKIPTIGAGPQTPIQQLEASAKFYQERLAGNAPALEKVNRLIEQRRQVLEASAAAEQKAAQAATEYKFRLDALHASQASMGSAYEASRASAAANEAQYQKNITTSQNYVQQMALVGRSQKEVRDLRMSQEFEKQTAGMDKSSAAYISMAAAHATANTRLKEQDTLQETAAKSAKGLGAEMKNAVERLGAAFVAYQLLHLAVRQGIVDTALHAARTETIGIAMEAAGKASGLSVMGLHAQEQAIKRLGITTEEARESLTRMMVAEIDVSKATQLARLAQDTAVISNMNSSDAFQQMIYGIQSGQVRVLRTIGINVQFAESYQQLAKVLQKSVLDLTEQEKAMARVEEVLKVAPRYYGLYEAAMTSTGKQLTSLKRYFQEAQDAIGKEFMPALDTVVKNLTNLLKILAEEPKLGSVGALLVGGGSLAVATKFMAGTGAASVVAGAAAGVGLAALTDYGATRLERGLSNVVVAINQWILEISGKGRPKGGEATPTGTAITPGEMWNKVRGAWDAYFKRRHEELAESNRPLFNKEDIARTYAWSVRNELVKTTSQAAINRTMDMTGGLPGPLPTSPAAVSFLKDLEKTGKQQTVYQQIKDALDAEERLTRQVRITKQAYEEADAQHLGSTYNAWKNAEKALEVYKRQVEEQKKFIELQEKGEAIARRIIGASRAITSGMVPAGREAFELAYARGEDSMPKQIQEIEDLNNARVRGEEQAFKTSQDISRETLEMLVKDDQLYWKDREATLDRTHKLELDGLAKVSTANVASALAVNNRRLIIEEQYLKRKLDLQLEEMTLETSIQKQTAEMTLWRDPEALYQRLKAIQAVTSNARLRQEIATSDLIEDARVTANTKATEIIESQQQRQFESLKRGFESLFDAAFQSAKSFTDALKRLLIAAFLTPLKDALGSMFANAIMRLRGAGGGGGGGGGLGGFDWGRIFGSSSKSATPSTATNITESPGWKPTALVGGLSLGAGASAGAGAGAGALSSLPMRSSPWYQAVPGGGGPVSPVYSASTSLAGQMTRNLGRAALATGGMMAINYGIQNRGTAGTLSLIGGGAALGGAYGGWLGAGIGAGAGAAYAGIRSLWDTAEDKVKAKLEGVYGVSIRQKDILRKVIDVARNSFGGDINAAINSPDIQQMVEIYALSSDQKTKRPTAQPVRMTQRGGSVYSGSGGGGGQMLPGQSAGSGGMGGYSGSGTTIIPLQIDSQSLGQVVISNGRVVTRGAISALRGNYGRKELLAMQVSPTAVLA